MKKNLSRIEAEIKRIVTDALGPDLIEEIRVSARDDHSGEPAFYVGVTMRFGRDVPGPIKQNEINRELVVGLAELDETRFPYLFFDALDDEREPEPDGDEFEYSDEGADQV